MTNNNLDLGWCSFFNPALVKIPTSYADDSNYRSNVQERSAVVGKGTVRLWKEDHTRMQTHKHLKKGIDIGDEGWQNFVNFKDHLSFFMLYVCTYLIFFDFYWYFQHFLEIWLYHCPITIVFVISCV